MNTNPESIQLQSLLRDLRDVLHRHDSTPRPNAQRVLSTSDRATLIIDYVALDYGIDRQDIKRRFSSGLTREARFVALGLCRELLDVPAREVAPFFNVKGSNVYHAQQTLTDLCDTEPKLRARVDGLRAEIKSALAIQATASNAKGLALELTAPITPRFTARARVFEVDGEDDYEDSIIAALQSAKSASSAVKN